MIRVIVDEQGAVLRIQNLPKRATAGLQRAIARKTIELANHIRANKLSGQVLRTRSGALRRSVRAYPPGVEMAVIRGEVAADRVTSVYGKVHEYGKRVRIPAHQVRAHVRAGGIEVRAHMRRAHDANFPERSFMRSALADWRAEIVQAIRQAVHEAVA